MVTRTREGVRELTVRTESDAQRALIYQRTLDDFPRLSKMYPDVIIDAGFRNATLREHFFTGARSYFNDLLFVWIETDDVSAQKRFFERGEEHGTPALRRRESMKKAFQPLDSNVPIFSYEGDPKDSIEAFCTFIQTEISR